MTNKANKTITKLWLASQSKNRVRRLQFVIMRSAIFWIFAAVLAFAAASTEKKIICYFGSWAVYRPGNGKIDITKINPHLCTHLVYTFVGLNSDNNNIAILDAWADLSSTEQGGGLDGFNKFNQLRGVNPSLKTLIAIGGWNQGSAKYSNLVANASSRKTFIENAIKFVRKYGFDGLDFDWEYPNQRGGVEADKENYILLLKELRVRFDQEGLILSAAVGAVEHSAKQSYNIAEVAKYLHFVNLMAYDMHGIWNEKTGNNAPLYAGSWETGEERLLNVNASVNYWLSQGAPAEKLILGMPLYGRSFTLDNSKNNGIGAAAHEKGVAGPYTQEPGTLGYNEICEAQLNDDWDVKYHDEQRVPYATKGNQWVSYDNPQSIQEKAELVNKLGLGGAMVWSIETDDFNGICGSKNPLLTTLNHVLRDGPPLATTTTTEDSSSLVICTAPGYIRDPYDCAVYYMCMPDSEQGYKKIKYTCPDGFVFDTKLNVCNSREKVDCSA